jgi:imidazolonepropionase-like amidohydrolase
MPISFDALAARDDLAALLDWAGVRVVISASGRDIRRLRQEAGIAVAYGLPRERALATITVAPAEVYGRSDIGAIAAGKRADVVLWSGDPLELSTVAEHIFIDGTELPMDTRQRRLVERYRGTGGGAATAP